ncbi:hypothetical protein BHE74_00010534 [Ensete ventricosum]|nr:hypothetical protein GW17_00047356 [Ensete ventricosum]RWW81101.1 hypothetical protein BHE74_00010534 [Ensete ventricosum]RZS05811.1 hypothetical protein BHM03_00036362 [Ensete ventricosum]
MERVCCRWIGEGVGERCWKGKEWLAGDQIRRQHDRDNCGSKGGRGWIVTAEAAGGVGGKQQCRHYCARLTGKAGEERELLAEEVATAAGRVQ